MASSACPAVRLSPGVLLGGHEKSLLDPVRRYRGDPNSGRCAQGGGLFGVGASTAVAVGKGVEVGALVAAGAGGLTGAGWQAEREKTSNKKQNRTAPDNLFNTKDTKFHKGTLITLCVLLSVVSFVSFVLKILLFTWPIQHQDFHQ